MVASPEDDDKTKIIGAPEVPFESFTNPSNVAYGEANLAPGSVLGRRYEIVQTLGKGGMGTVFKAHDTEVERMVALKVIRSELAARADILQRFRQELVLARKITHRNIVRIYDLGVVDGLRFISMEYIEGLELSEILQDRKKLPPKEAAEIMVQVCHGLTAAHAEGVVHRDLKPQNIMIDHQGRAAVMDFGIAHSTDVSTLAAQDSGLAGQELAANLTQIGSVVGTPRYMSPEQARAEKIDQRSDLFTAGLIFYEMLTGDPPARSGTLVDNLLDRASKQISPAASDTRIPKPLKFVIARCLQLDPARRYQSAEHMARDLEIWLGVRKRHRTNWKLVSGLAAMIVLLAATLLYNLRPKASATHAPVKILVADLRNQTGSAVLNGTLEPALTTALEGASFITTYNRGQARKTLETLSAGEKLDENGAQLVAQREGVDVIVSGSIERNGTEYAISTQALDARTKKVIDEERASASSPDELNRAVGRVASGLRKALGDATPRSAQIAAAETFSSKSLEASQQYAQAQELQWQGKWDDALKAYSRSIELDSELGRAYAGRAVILANMGRRQDAEDDFKRAMSKIDRMTDREKYRTRGAYYLLERDYDKAIEQFKALEKQYPADSAGIANLALAYFYQRNMSAALEEGRHAIAIYPDNLLQLNNVALFAMYAGDFGSAIQESERLLMLNPSFEKAYICLGISQLASGDEPTATGTYRRLAALSAWGASASAIGLADIALLDGRPDDAISILEKDDSADVAAKGTSHAAEKQAMLAQAWLMKGQISKAIAAARSAADGSTDERLLYPAAIVLLESGKLSDAIELSRKLNQHLEPDPGAYAKLIEAEAQMRQKNYREAIRIFRDAQKIADTWLGRFGLGRAYIEAGAYTDADTEFDACVKRKGEASAVFLDDEPAWRYFAPVYYYQGRAREGLQSPAAAESYRSYLKLRGRSTSDPLTKDAQKRLSALEEGGRRVH